MIFKSSSLSKELFLFGSFFLVFYAALIVVQTIFLFLGIGLQNAVTIFALCIALAYFIGAYRRIRPEGGSLIPWLLIIFLTILVTGVISSYFMDLSWDGRDYQQKAIRKLIEGYNPVFEVVKPTDVYYNVWINHYPKGFWLSAASVAKLTGLVEAGKIFNLLLILAVFSLSLSFFLSSNVFKPWQSLGLSLFLAANPVSIYQSLSFYHDGQVSSVFILLLLLTFFSLRKLEPILLYPALISSIIIGFNIKFTATAYFGILLIFLLILNLIVHKRLKSIRGLVACVVTGSLIGLILVGYNPYVTNTLRFGNPFYPVYGSDAYNKEFIVGWQMPSNFVGKSQLEKLYLSIFSRSQNIGIRSSSGAVKNPFSVDLAEIKEFGATDVRIGGWGPLFAASLSVSLILLILLFWFAWRKGLLVLALSGLVVGTALLNSEAWWARYAPQIFLLPLMVLAVVWMMKNRSLTILSYLLTGLIFLNIFLVSGSYLTWNLRQTMGARAELTKLGLSGEEILVYYGKLDTTTYQLKEYNIPYQTVSEMNALPCPRQLILFVLYSPIDCPIK